MEGANPDFIAFIAIMLICLIVAFLYYIIWAILHKILSRKFDNVLFSEPHFSIAEIRNYQTFPLSLFKSLSYIILIAAPALSKRKRFRYLEEDVPVNKGLKLACKFHLGIGLFGAFMFFVYFGYLGVAIYIFT